MKLNKHQFAFLLDIKVEDARAKMCHAWCRSKGIQNKAFVTNKNKIFDEYPPDMEVGLLAKELNLPSLPEMIQDIKSNYLSRSATKYWILNTYPETEIKKKLEKGSKLTLNVPRPLLSLLPTATVETIKTEWRKRFPNAIVK